MLRHRSQAVRRPKACRTSRPGGATSACRFPSFGFGPPMTRKDQAVWACLAHRAELERALTQKTVHGVALGPKRLL